MKLAKYVCISLKHYEYSDGSISLSNLIPTVTMLVTYATAALVAKIELTGWPLRSSPVHVLAN